MTTFNTDEFLDSATEGSNSTVLIPVPQGEYLAQIEDIAVRSAKESTVLDVTWLVMDERVQKETKREKPTVRQGVFLDLTSDNKLDMQEGKNVQLGRLREGVGQNWKDKPWAFRMLKGASAYIQVSHRPNPADPRDVFADVKKVAKTASGSGGTQPATRSARR